MAPMIRGIVLSSGMRNRETDNSPVSFLLYFGKEVQTVTNSEFRRNLTELSMGQLKYMFQIIRTKPAINYYGANRAKIYRNDIYSHIISKKVRGAELEIWQS